MASGTVKSQNQVLILQNAMLFADIVLPISEQVENFSIIVSYCLFFFVGHGGNV